MRSVGIHGELPQPNPGEITYSHTASRMAANTQDFPAADRNHFFELRVSKSGGKTRFPFIDAGAGIGKCQTLIKLYLDQLEEQVHPDPFWQIILHGRGIQFSFDEVLGTIEQAQGEPDNYQHPVFLQYISQDQPDRRRILHILFAVLRFLLRLCCIAREPSLFANKIRTSCCR